jgi:hypothetical protein
MTRLRNYIQHRLNPLHFYCRLRDMGVRGNTAVRMSAIYERFLYRICL